MSSLLTNLLTKQWQSWRSGQLGCTEIARSTTNKLPTAGFTLIEILVVIVIVGIMSAIIAPSWLGFLRQQELNTSQNRIFTAIRRAQSLAKREQIEYQITFRVTATDQVQYAVHNSLALPSPPTIANINSLPWETLSESVYIPNSSANGKDDSGIGYITFQSAGSGNTKIWRMQFDAKGNISDRLGRVILQHKADTSIFIARQQNKRKMRCVFVSTALGMVRTATDQDCNY
ncbi:MAG: prepilin-type N-terminal cleavage/methylation domain-containing protein [Pseudanabaena sp. ELA607]